MLPPLFQLVKLHRVTSALRSARPISPYYLVLGNEPLAHGLRLVGAVSVLAAVAAIAGTARPSQLSATIRARSLQSAGACRAPESLRIFPASLSSSGGRALKNFGMGLASTYPFGVPATHTLKLTT